jgi:hypothetical protein
VTRSYLILAVLLLTMGTACGKSGGSAGVDATAAIEEFDVSAKAGARPRSRLNTAVLAEPAKSREAALAQLDAEDPDVRIAALYALSLTLKDGDGDALAPALESKASGERVLAAGGMLSLGDGRGVPVLIEALGNDEPLPFGAPPIRVWQQARAALLAFSGRDFGLGKAATARRAKATAPKWKSWWMEAKDSFEVVRAPGLFRR